MNKDVQINPEPRADVLHDMRALAERGTTVRELTRLVQSRLGFDDTALIPVLSYFAKAFTLPLLDILPIREWLGTDQDKEIDALILPLINRNRDKWSQENVSRNGPADGPEPRVESPAGAKS
jgi:hypothetical protein